MNKSDFYFIYRKMVKIIWAIFLSFGIVWTIAICYIDTEHSSYTSIGSWTMLWLWMLVDGYNRD